MKKPNTNYKVTLTELNDSVCNLLYELNLLELSVTGEFLFFDADDANEFWTKYKELVELSTKVLNQND